MLDKEITNADKDGYIKSVLTSLYGIKEFESRARTYVGLRVIASLTLDEDRKKVSEGLLCKLREELFPIAKKLCDEANEKTKELVTA